MYNYINMLLTIPGETIYSENQEGKTSNLKHTNEELGVLFTQLPNLLIDKNSSVKDEKSADKSSILPDSGFHDLTRLAESSEITEQNERVNLFYDADELISRRSSSNLVRKGEYQYIVHKSSFPLRSEDSSIVSYVKIAKRKNREDTIFFINDENSDTNEIATNNPEAIKLFRGSMTCNLYIDIPGKDRKENTRSEYEIAKQAVRHIAANENERRDAEWREKKDGKNVNKRRRKSFRRKLGNTVLLAAIYGSHTIASYFGYGNVDTPKIGPTELPLVPAPVELIVDWNNWTDHKAQGIEALEDAVLIEIGDNNISIPLVVDDSLNEAPRAYLNTMDDNEFNVENVTGCAGSDDLVEVVDGIIPSVDAINTNTHCNNYSKEGMYEVRLWEGIVQIDSSSNAHALVIKGDFAGKEVTISTQNPEVNEKITASFIDDTTILLASDGELPSSGSVFIHNKNLRN